MPLLTPLAYENIELLVKISGRLSEGNCSSLEQLIALALIHRYGLALEMLTHPDDKVRIQAIAKYTKLILLTMDNDYTAMLELRHYTNDLNQVLKTRLAEEKKKVQN